MNTRTFFYAFVALALPTTVSSARMAGRSLQFMEEKNEAEAMVPLSSVVKMATGMIEENSATETELKKDAFVMVDGRPLPNLESPLVALVHAKHCETVVAEALALGKVADQDDVSAMHLAHCESMLAEASVETTKQAACDAVFPFLADKAAAKRFSISFSYRYFLYISFSFARSVLPKMTLEEMVSYNFMQILMKEADRDADEYTPMERAYVESMHSDKTKKLAGLARVCSD